MKICWDNLEKVWLSKNGNLKIGHTTYIEMDSCERCGKPYLVQKRHYLSHFCSHSCAGSGKIRSIETRKRISKVSSSHIGALGSNYKGGIKALGLAGYDTYKTTLGLYEEVRKRENTEVLEVKCVYCGRWYAPKFTEVRHRLVAINSLNIGEQRLYCSENCKQACPIYGRQKYPKGFKQITSREVSTYLRQMVFERDNWTCQICGKTIKGVQLHCHHMDPVAQNPLFQNDTNSCITLCKDCHKEVHNQHGCRYIDLRCKSI